MKKQNIEQFTDSAIADIYRQAQPRPVVSLAVFWSRLKSFRFKSERRSAFDIHEALYISQSDYKRKFRTRKTYVALDGVRHDLFSLYSGHKSPAITYRAFYQRAKRLKRGKLLDNESLRQAALLTNAEWISFFGGGRRRHFIYRGDLYPTYFNRSFSSIAAFLRTIGRYNDRTSIWARLKCEWTIDAALEEPIIPIKDRTGTIYLISCNAIPMQYVGLTVMSLAQRWRCHVHSALESNGNCPLARAIRLYGPKAFTQRILESGLSQSELAQREIHWIEKLNTLAPNGLNSRPGGQTGGRRGKPVTYGGETFRSHEHAAFKLSRRTGLARHVIIRRIQLGQPLPQRARTTSYHREAGSNLWRRWKSLKNGLKRRKGSGALEPVWENYDDFASDVRPGYRPELRLIRIDDAKPWGPRNFRWATRQEAVESVHGKTYVVQNREYRSLQALARAFGLGLSTLHHRIEKQGLPVDEAVSRPVGPRSRRARISPVVVGDRSFESEHRAATYAAESYGLTFNQARYRIRRGLPLRADNTTSDRKVCGRGRVAHQRRVPSE